MLNKKISHLLLFALVVGLTSIAMTDLQVQDQPEATVAWNVQGTVTDAETGEPIPDVEVQIEELAVSETTDDEGKFKFTDIQEGGIYTIVVDHEGYERYEETHEIKSQNQNQWDTQTDENRTGENQTGEQNQNMQKQGDKNKLEIELTPSNETGIE